MPARRRLAPHAAAEARALVDLFHRSEINDVGIGANGQRLQPVIRRAEINIVCASTTRHRRNRRRRHTTAAAGSSRRSSRRRRSSSSSSSSSISDRTHLAGDTSKLCCWSVRRLVRTQPNLIKTSPPWLGASSWRKNG
eukprot:SAG11_NODE_224_length_12103_cov_8.087054_5_plen_138_part_00